MGQREMTGDRSIHAQPKQVVCGPVVLHVLVGNGDAHGKNYSLLHEHSGAVRLAPLYDVMSTLYCGDERLAMYVDGVRRADRVSTDRILNGANSWEWQKRSHPRSSATFS